jgi:hypothetical protein
MSQSLGPYTDRYGLVFGYDTSETANSFKGEPTVNLSYNNGQGGSEYLSSIISWVNVGSWEYNDNETDVPKPSIPGVNTTNLRVQSGRNTTDGGSVHYGCGYTTISPSRTYTVSVWYRQNRAGVSQPYLRTNITNVGLANLAYNGNTDSSTWPVNQWIRISATGTVASNENGVYISNYIGTYVGDKVWYFGHQVEEKDHVTPLVAGTRSVTQGLLDISGNKTINTSNASFNSSGELVFDGTNDFLSVGSFNLYSMGSCTLEAIIYMNNLSSPDNSYSIFGGVSDEGYHGYHEIRNSGGYKMTFWSATDGWRYSNTSLSAQTWYHIAWVWSERTLTFYLNGIQDGNTTFTTLSPYGLGFNRISSFPNERYMNGKISVAKVYSSSLSATDVLRNYNNYKKRFNI